MKKIILMLALFISAVCIGKENPNMEAVWFLCEQYKDTKKNYTESYQKIGMVYVAGIDPELLKVVRSEKGCWDDYTSIGHYLYKIYHIKQYESLTDSDIQEAKFCRLRIKIVLNVIRSQYKKLQEVERKKAPDYQEKLRKQLNYIEL